jgi:hypothetical protein
VQLRLLRLLIEKNYLGVPRRDSNHCAWSYVELNEKKILFRLFVRAVAALQGNAANPMNYRRCPPISCINANAGCYRIVEQGQIERARAGVTALPSPTRRSARRYTAAA